MKFVALVSGGKDSCFNIMHCQANGHELAALANLHPPYGNESDEMDSFMYQTVGYSILSLYEECFGVPMYRAEIKGRSLDTGLDYKSARKDDETEDLFELLKEVVREQPEIEAVSVGAILSTYQRTRVENVCGRLGLTCLAYLWQRDQSELLDEMISSGVNAILIKVAGIGLTADKHLGKTLAEVRPELHKLNRMFGSHVCGEGGEYETLVVDCPAFRKARIELERTETVRDENGDVAYLKVWGHTVAKTDGLPVEVPAPNLFEEDMQELYDELSSEVERCERSERKEREVVEVGECVQKLAKAVMISNLTVESNENMSIEEEITELFEKLKLKMREHAGTEDVYQFTFVSLILRDIGVFGQANAAYKQFFAAQGSEPNPPARACISSLLPAGKRAMLSATVSTLKKEARKGLHVQGRSYWAPANIGPYSQAIGVDERVYLAGQIPLVPASMRVYDDGDACGQAVLALQNLRRVREAVSSQGEFAYLVAYGADEEAVRVAVRVGERVVEGCFGVQVVSLPAGARVEFLGAGVDATFGIDDDDDDDEEKEEKRGSVVFCCDSAGEVRRRVAETGARGAIVYAAGEPLGGGGEGVEGYEIVHVERVWDGAGEREFGVVALF
ncbi:hypothetical protein BZA70DRAFT_188687 [Myxozyma melibiosi]|uniref:Diphthine--ammonia ligase n=1 Tax=Myxozyma melibiosi TaxID=54550 RepID=A0ABR1F353_9ASCO